MKSKLGIISGLILSLFIAGSAFAYPGNAAAATTKSQDTAKVTKPAKPKKHRKHQKASKKKTTSMKKADKK